MGENRLDKLIQEKINNLQEAPDEKVWTAISNSLDKRKKSKVVPIWWKLGGVAAVLAIAVVAITQFSNKNGGDSIITNAEQIEPAQNDGANDQRLPILKEKKPQNSGIVGIDESEKEEHSQITPASQDTPYQIVGADEPKRKTGNFVPTPQNHRNLSISEDGSAKPASVQKKEGASNKAEIKTEIAENALSKTGLEDKDRGDDKDKTPNEKEAYIAVNGTGRNANIKEQNDQNKRDAQNGLTESTPSNNGQKLDPMAKDSMAKKSLYDEIAAQEQLEVLEAPRKKWSAGPNIAPVYFNAFGEGSPVHSIFVPNAKSGETNLSYGLSIAYEISDRLSLRSGINKVDYGYGTSDVEFTSSVEGSVNGQIDNIDYALTSRNLVVQSKAGDMVVAVNDAPETKALDVSAKSASRDGNMSQQFGYLEVPLELNYALVDRRVGLNLIGGFSSLFLVDNAVTLTSGNQTLEMGEANNINSVNFSTNVGFGIDYKFSSKIKLNLEPIFKYQLNTFSNVDGTFQPFSLGVYSGLSFKF